ncbi:MAG: sigma-54-dependent Fis family transcriptional regulator [bacterium]|nr:sigma-54-dependent Fis family transcriptional regulator [bacterium]
MRPDPLGSIEGARPEGDAQRYGILVVDDERGILESIELTLDTEYRVYTAESAVEGLEILDREDIALVIADQVMPAMSGVEFLEAVLERNPSVVRMMLTGYTDLSSLIRGINEGHIYRYITKPWEPEELRMDVKRALEAYELGRRNEKLTRDLEAANHRLESENRYLRQEVKGRFAFDGILGDSPAMQQIFDLTDKVSRTDATVLITGETGTGKDLVARAIHHSGNRSGGLFVAQNCGALPDTLLESELFGHKRGAFTGAERDKEGLFQACDGGTIFLDEIGETESGMQVRLLRVLHDGEIRPLGSSKTLHVDVRVVAATNRDLERAVAEGRFREDLYYRLRVVEIELPPLRERREDIPALAHHFLSRAESGGGSTLQGFTIGAMDRLVSHEWRGNVRELENEIERVVALSGDETLVSRQMLSEAVRGNPSFVMGSEEEADLMAAAPGRGLSESVDALKRRMILDALRSEGSKAAAAKQLGIPRQSLQKMIKRLGLTHEDMEA